MNNKKKKNIIRISIIICAFALGIAGYYFFFKNKTKEDDIKNEEPKKEEVVTNEDTKEENKMLEELEPYYKKNDEIVGWLKIDDTPIDYPVMCSQSDKDSGDYFYLNRNFDKKKDGAGSLFIEWNASPDTPNCNSIIYGHNMAKSQTMFGSLKKYAKEDFYNNHKTITFNTLYKRGEYEIVAAFFSEIKSVDDTSFKYYKFLKANNEEEFNDFVTNIKKLSEYDTKVVPQYGDTFITLSTCTTTDPNNYGRFAVVARKKK